VLTNLAHRSKAHWGYDATFIERASAQLTITAQTIEEHEIWVLEDPGGRVMGFHRVIPGEPAVLEDLWLEPESIGVGLGRRLWGHAVAVALAFGAAALELDAEPNAVGFYERMGAVTVGSTASSFVGAGSPECDWCCGGLMLARRHRK
jgi:GNAT superfamily N-acetyltransferase